MTLADILVSHRHDMLWMPAVRREAPENQWLSDADLTSRFPLLFDRLIKGLGGESPPIMPAPGEHAATLIATRHRPVYLLRESTHLQQSIRSIAVEGRHFGDFRAVNRFHSVRPSGSSHGSLTGPGGRP